MNKELSEKIARIINPEYHFGCDCNRCKDDLEKVKRILALLSQSEEKHEVCSCNVPNDPRDKGACLSCNKPLPAQKKTGELSSQEFGWANWDKKELEDKIFLLANKLNKVIQAINSLRGNE